MKRSPPAPHDRHSLRVRSRMPTDGLTPERGRVPALILLVLLALTIAYVLLLRPRTRTQAIEGFLEVDNRRDCCFTGASGLHDECRGVLETLLDLDPHDQLPRALPAWMPDPLLSLLSPLRGTDEAALQARVIFRTCPAARELARSRMGMDSAPEARLCGLLAGEDERENLAREAARRGRLRSTLSDGTCAPAGFDAGLARIQIDFERICGADACLEVLLAAPPASRQRLEAIVLAHPDAILAALEPALGPHQDPRLEILLAILFRQDARALAALARGDLSGLDLEAALNLLELPLNPRKIFLLRRISESTDKAASSVAGVLLDAAEAGQASPDVLHRGLIELAAHQCVLVERAAERLDLGEAARANAALPALQRCPEAVPGVLGDPSRLALTSEVLDAALGGLLGDLREALIERLTQAGPIELDLALSAAQEGVRREEANAVLTDVLELLDARVRQVRGGLRSTTPGDGSFAEEGVAVRPQRGVDTRSAPR